MQRSHLILGSSWPPRVYPMAQFWIPPLVFANCVCTIRSVFHGAAVSCTVPQMSNIRSSL